MVEITINEKNCGGRLDKAVFKYLDKASPGFVYKMLRKKNITLNDKKAAPGEILKEGDSIKLYLSEETLSKFKSGRRSQTSEAPKKSDSARLRGLRSAVVYEDENIVALNKPAGLLSQKAMEGDISVNDFLRSYIPHDDMFMPGAANRLDRNTSGIILAGKSLSARRELSKAIKERNVSKKYLALVAGNLSEAARMEAYLLKDGKTNTVTVCDGAPENADRVITNVAPISGNGKLTLIEAELVTGKTHQIRAQLSFSGHPLAGDTKYGNRAKNEYFREKYGLKSQFLHAYKTEFAGMGGILEYLNGKSIMAPLPSLFEKILDGEGLRVFEDTETCGAAKKR